jgi:hypothetical protein
MGLLLAKGSTSKRVAASKLKLNLLFLTAAFP